uniref:hypothetical protein n=1 Tax=uncultured Pseudoalteromonas sp. TaxID=114053 RepID=UPI0030DC4051
RLDTKILKLWPKLVDHYNSKAIWNTVWFELFKGTWDNSNFIIENRVGEAFFSFNSDGELVT